MKLDENLIEQIVREVCVDGRVPITVALRRRLRDVDLVIKYGDSSQSILVENKPPKK